MTRPYLRLLAEAAEAVGGLVEFEPRYQHVGQFTNAHGRGFPLFGNALGLNSDAATALANDKTYTVERLSSKNLFTAAGQLVVSPVAHAVFAERFPAMNLPSMQAAQRFAAQHGFDVFLKPNSGKAGDDVYRSTDADSFQALSAHLVARHSHIRIEAPIVGDDYRVLVLDGRARAAYLRHPFGITGTGRDSIATLIDRALATRGSHGFSNVDDPLIQAVLRRNKLSMLAILAMGQFLPLRSNANISTGGRLTDLSATMPKALCDIAVVAAKAVGLRYAGVDLITTDPTNARAIAVLEVNSSPGLDGFASHGATQWALSRAILQDALAALGSSECFCGNGGGQPQP